MPRAKTWKKEAKAFAGLITFSSPNTDPGHTQRVLDKIAPGLKGIEFERHDNITSETDIVLDKDEKRNKSKIHIAMDVMTILFDCSDLAEAKKRLTRYFK